MNNLMTIRVPIQPGKLGVTFSGSPPMVTDVAGDSPMRNKLTVGNVVSGVSIPHRFEVHCVEDSNILSELLSKTSSHLRRSLLILTEEDDSASTNSETEFHVTLPPGKLGLTFDGDEQPTVAKVWDYCPVRDFVEEGQWLKSVLIPGEPELFCNNISARDVYEVLRCQTRRQGRVLVLTNPPLAVAEPVLSNHPMDESYHTPQTHHSAVTAMSVSSGTSGTAIDATIEQDQTVLTVQLRPRQRVRCDHEHMLYMSGEFRVKTHGMKVREFQKGYPLGLTEFIYEGYSGQGTVAFGSGGKVVRIKLDDHGGRIICQAGAYLCSEMSVKVYVETIPVPNGDSFLIRLSGTGHVWLMSCGKGSIISKTLARGGETLRCATDALIAFEKIVQYSSHRIRGGLSSVTTGKDCSWTELVGPGTVWLQSSARVDREASATNASKSFQSINQASRNGFERRGNKVEF